MFFRSRSSRSLLLIFAPLVLVLALLAEELPRYSVDVNVVNVLATVRDKHGKIVNNLSPNDFVLEEDGRAQSIKYFARESDLPLTLGLLVDTSLSQRRVLDQERSASGSFLDTVLRENKDSAFLIHFDREVELLQDLTTSREKLRSALRLLQTSQPQPDQDRNGGSTQSGGGNPGGGYPGGGYPGGGYPRGGRHRYPGGGGGGGGQGKSSHRAGTLLYDSVFLASDELMQKQHGRKALIVLTDGVDRGSKTTLEHAIESAQRADTVVYSILFKDDEAYGGGWGRGGMGGPWGRGGGGSRPQEERPDGKKILERISQETGGRIFQVSKKETVDQIYQQIQDELRNQYNLGYTPVRAANSPDYHKIRLTTKQKGLMVQARDGYYSSKQVEAEKGSEQK